MSKSSRKQKKLRSKMEKIFTDGYIPVDLFNIDVYFTVDKSDFQAMCDWIKVEAVTEVGGRCMLNIREDGSRMLYIGVFNDDVGTLAHECVHGAMFIANEIGHDILPSDEIVPYLTGYLVRKCKEKMV